MKSEAKNNVLFSWYFHLKLPVWAHKLEVGLTFFEQLILPYMMLVPHRNFRIFAAVAEIFFQFCIVGTGNYAWINYVGILPCIALFDDEFIELIERKIFSPTCGKIVALARIPIMAYNRIIVSLLGDKLVIPMLNGPDQGEDNFDFRTLSTKDREDVCELIKDSISLESNFKKSKCNEDGVKGNLESGTVLQKTSNFVVWIITSMYKLFGVCLAIFMIYKAKDPIKELFGPAPWINAYDEYFFMTSQGLLSSQMGCVIKPLSSSIKFHCLL